MLGIHPSTRLVACPAARSYPGGMVTLADGNLAATVGPQVVILNGDTGEVVRRKIVDIPTGATTDIAFNGLQVRALQPWLAPSGLGAPLASSPHARRPSLEPCPTPFLSTPDGMQVLPDGNIVIKNLGRPAGCPLQGYMAITGAPRRPELPPRHCSICRHGCRRSDALHTPCRWLAHMLCTAGAPMPAMPCACPSPWYACRRLRTAGLWRGGDPHQRNHRCAVSRTGGGRALNREASLAGVGLGAE